MSTQATESMSFFDARNPLRQRTLLQTQYDPSTPLVEQLRRGTNLIVPDFRVETRLDHFPDDLYDLRPSSHLVRFMKALLGDSGAGHNRKRYLMARLQQALHSTHFYDLDRFYGALFGAQRLRIEKLPFDPMLHIATGDEWDKIYSVDSQYRERIVALAKAIPLGATRPGMKVAAEAITGVECEVTETWRLLDYYRRHGYRTPDDIIPREWREVEAIYDSYNEMLGDWDTIRGVPKTYYDYNRNYREVRRDFPTYGAADDGSIPATTWFEVMYIRYNVGKVRNDRTEFTIRPKKHYVLNTRTSRNERAQDDYAIRRVINVLKPAASRLTLDMEGVDLHGRIFPGQISSDSNYWEVETRVTPRVAVSLPQNTYPLSAGQAKAGISQGEERVIPRPPFSQVQGTSWTYNNEIVSVRSYTLDDQEFRSDGTSNDVVTSFNGEVQVYSADRGVLDARRSEAARLVSDGIMVAHPYSQDRKVVTTHD